MSMDRVSGAAPVAKVEAAARERGLSAAALAETWCENGWHWLSRMRATERPRQVSIDKVRRAIAGDAAVGSAEAAPGDEAEAACAHRVASLRATVAAEAGAASGSRMAARRLGQVTAPGQIAPVSEIVARAVLENAGDAIAVVRRRWPELLDRLIEAAREKRVPTGEMLADALDAGLEALVVRELVG